jgi:YfiH family protein
MFEPVSINDLILFQSALFNSCEIVNHGFSSRTGGVSSGFFHSLNLGLNNGDDRQQVIENRMRFYNAIRITAEQTVQGVQIHGDRIRIVTKPGTYPETDGFITTQRKLVLLIKTADCPAVLLVDPRQKVIAAVHAGWRSVVKGILEKAVRLLVSKFGSQPANMLCAIGPAIRGCCYEVQEDVWKIFPEDVVIRRSEKYFLDLPLAIRQRLLRQGILKNHLDDSDLCPACRADLFFSHRRDNGQTGRMMAAIYLRQVE